MFNFILPSLNKILAIASAVAAFLLSVFAYGLLKVNQGKKEKEVEELKQDAVKRKIAREAAFKEKRDVDGISDSDLVDRLRRRSDDWGSL
jgi:hypothetical protein